MVAVQQPGLLASSAASIANLAALTVVGLIFAMFVLASGDMFYVKLVEAFPGFSNQRNATSRFGESPLFAGTFCVFSGGSREVRQGVLLAVLIV